MTVETNGNNSGKSGRGRVAGYACIAAATLFWGVSATLGRAVFTGRMRIGGDLIPSISPLMLAQSRTTFAFLMLVPLLLALRGRDSLKMSRRDVLDCALVGTFGIAASNFFYYYAVEKTSVATAIILQYTAPVFVLLWMVARGRQRATPPRLLGVALAVIGSVLAIGVVGRVHGAPWLWFSTKDLNLNVMGVGAAMVAALAWAFYNVFGQHLVSVHDRWRVMVWSMGGCAVGWLLINPPWKITAAHYTHGQWLFMLLFSIFSVLVPYIFYFLGLELLDPTRAIVTSCLEPVFAIAVAALALGETVDAIQIAGVIVVLTATLMVQIPEKEEREAVIVGPVE